MMKRKTLIFIAGIMSILFLSGCTQMETDLQLTRKIFNGLCSGNQRVQNSIDWESLQAMDVDVGKAYSSIISEKDRRDYRKMFFYNLSYTFRASGGRISSFSNWRVQNRDSNNTIVATDTPSGNVLLLTLSHKAGKRKLTAINWQQ